MRRRALTSAVLGLGLALTACSVPGGEQDRSAAEPASPSGPSPSSTSPSAGLSPSPSVAASSAPSTAPASPTGRATPRRTERRTAAWGPTRAELQRARAAVDRLRLPQLAGQVIVAEYDGQGAPSTLVNRLHLGGVIVMSDNVASTGQVRRSNRALQTAARGDGRRWPVFIGVDQEGGVVERVQGEATRFPSFMSAGAARDTRLTRQAAAGSGAELRDLGFSVVFAPVADVTSGPADPTIGSRSPSSRPELVARHSNAAVDGYLAAGVLPVAKHFPGHGSVPADSHVELPVQTRSLRQLRRVDLVPFREGERHGVPSVMVGHLDVRAVDPGTPATVSRPVVTGMLRRDLGFDGLVVTDAMNMAAVADRYPTGAAAVHALRAGNDVVLMPPDPARARDAIVRAVREGRLDRARLEQAAARQVAVLRHQAASRPSVRGGAGESGAASYRLSAGAATVVSGRCGRRLVGTAVRATGPADAVRRFEVAARKAGLRTGTGTHVALVGYGGSPARGDVVVTTDTPYPLGRSSARVARIAMYGDTPGAMRALVQVLLGRADAPGRLPVPVRGVPRRSC